MRRITWAMLGDARGRLLDVGCGPGWDLAALPPGAFGVGLDRLAQEISYRPLVQADAGRMPFRTGSVDLVLALDLLEQRGVNPEAALREIRRALRCGGYLLARVPAHPWLYGPHDRQWRGQRRYRKTELMELVAGAGFSIRRLTYANAVLFPIAAAVRLGGRAGLLKEDPLRLANPFNRLLLSVLGSEARWLRKHDLPIGLSLVCLAEA